MLRSPLRVLLAAPLLFASADLRAQPTDASKSEIVAIFEEAHKQMGVGNYKAACPAFDLIAKKDRTAIKAMWDGAECYEKWGKLATAWARFVELVGVVTAEKQPGSAEKAQARADALKPKLATLTLVVPPSVRAAEGLKVTRNDAAVEPPEWDLTIPVDEGEYRIVVAAKGRVRWETTITVAASAKVSATLEIGAPEPKGKDIDKDKGREHGHEKRVIPPPEGASGLRTGGFVAGAAGGVALGVGGVLGGLAMGKKGESDKHCGPAIGVAGDKDACDPQGIGLRSDTLTFAHASTALFVVGGVALAAGVTMVILAPRSGEKKPASARVTLGPAGASFSAAW